MSYRYPASFIDPGLNTLVPPTPTTLYNLYSWGRNNNGQLGLGNTTLYSSPVQLGSLTDWSQVSSGIYHTLAIKTNGTLWSWGYNGVGSLGLGDTTNRSSPVQVGALTNWLSVSAGYQISAAIKTNGTLWP